ncbi:MULTISPECIES: cell division protein SepF [Actinomyces]|uniref:Cell division protein SepF n=1 Tax=Actinomyces respiraculi TaxID=2744574 RepID=A0A7T0LM25_9ACTO|nr:MULTISPECIES: cell division protein SepF [Actinomyces]QPL06274.1 cell division protein SepF [Actinomyces respiraculi]
MSALHKMTNFLGYSQPVEEDYDEAYEAPYADNGYEAGPAYAAFEDEAPVAVPDLRRIVTVHPTTYNEARVIGEAFRDGVPVIINLTHMGEADARRMVDFSAGLVFGLNGAIERVTPRVFLLTPATVEIDGGEQAEESSRFFNQS